MKDIHICRKCGFVSTLKSEFIKVCFRDEFGENTIGEECKECNSEAPANIQQQVQADPASSQDSLT